MNHNVHLKLLKVLHHPSSTMFRNIKGMDDENAVMIQNYNFSMQIRIKFEWKSMIFSFSIGGVAFPIKYGNKRWNDVEKLIFNSFKRLSIESVSLNWKKPENEYFILSDGVRWRFSNRFWFQWNDISHN